MVAFQRRFVAVILRVVLVLVAYQLSRLCFLFLNADYFASTPRWEIARILFYGTWFDFSVVALLNSVFVLLYLVPFPFIYRKGYYKAVDSFFVAVNMLVLLFNFVDCEYFKFIFKRSTFDVFSYVVMSNDALVLLPRFIVDFWYVPLLWLLTAAGLLYAVMKWDVERRPLPAPRWQWLVVEVPQLVLLLGLMFAGSRGLGLKPMQIITASRFTSTANFPLILNTPFTILHTMKDDGLPLVEYMDETEAKNVFDPVKTYYDGGRTRRDNVVIIMLESFSFSYVGALSGKQTYTPFLDSLIGQGLVFDHAFANGKKSIDAMPSILASLPELIEEPYISSQYGGNKIMGLPAVLATQGYHTSFFHGGRNGTFRFDDFSKAAGVEHYYGMSQYTGPAAYDGDWGIRDEEFLQFFAQKLDSFPQPFFSCVFTLSSHHPYVVPEQYEDIFRGGELPIYKTIQYADYSLRKFFESAATKPWFANTLFVLVADHAAQEEDYSHGRYADRYHIPLIIFHPGEKGVKGVCSSVVQQADIMPSVIDYLNIPGSYVCFGSSVFDSQASRLSVQYLAGVYSVMNGGVCLQWDGSRVLATEPLDSTTTASRELTQHTERLLKSIVQQYNQRMVGNRLTDTK